MGFFRDLGDRAAEINVHDADVKLPRQPPADFRHERRIIVPDLRCQRARFLQDAPKPFGRPVVAGINLEEPAGAEHLRGWQANSAMLPHHLSKGIVRKTGHRRLENRRIDDQGTNFQRTNHEEKSEVFVGMDKWCDNANTALFNHQGRDEFLGRGVCGMRGNYILGDSSIIFRHGPQKSGSFASLNFDSLNRPLHGGAAGEEIGRGHGPRSIGLEHRGRLIDYRLFSSRDGRFQPTLGPGVIGGRRRQRQVGYGGK